ncbi:MAG TPA: response regulator transcription factor [Actinomycetota bacterium]
MKVLLVDDHTLVRRGLAHLLAASLDDAQISEAENADEALAVLRAGPQDIALVDIRMPGKDGLELLKEVRATWPTLPVIILTCFDDSDYVKRALADGAAGYLLKDSSLEDLQQAINVALSGSGNVLSPRAVRNLFDNAAQAVEHGGRRPHAADAGLTRREVDILSFLSEGSSNREISKALFLSEKTVKAHLAAIFRKLGVTNRTKAAMAAIGMGLGPHSGMPSGNGAAANGWADNGHGASARSHVS